jgi:hypothetical protein
MGIPAGSAICLLPFAIPTGRVQMRLMNSTPRAQKATSSMTAFRLKNMNAG